MEKLFEEGFNSLDAIKLIEPDDLPKSKISKGQRKLIIASVEKLNNALAGQTGDTAHCSSASSVQQHNNVQIEANEQHSEQTVIIPNQMVTRNSQLPNQNAPGSSQPINLNATWSSQAANQTATGSSQPASQTATGSSQPANQTVSGNSQPPNQTVTGRSHLQQPGLPEEDPYLRALVQQLQSGQSAL